MSKLKLGSIVEEKAVRLTIDIPSAVHRDLVAYAASLSAETGQAVDASKLICPMVVRFMASDRAFSKARRAAADHQARSA
ncbi:DUF2274 domain-containing protein [Brevundimonas aurifodinae]|uniref:DUF2274 domain-containing protein n=1 Tax=Brevundimonas aurifodinae TaxID=1508312 RepID=A0ABV1NNB7_9CAUL